MPYVSTRNLRLYYERMGEGIPFIIHAHNHRKYLMHQAPYFAQFYDVIVPDRRGCGKSDDVPGPWTAADLAADLRDLMDELGLEKAIVGGISLGGVVSCQFGLDYPDRSNAIVVGHTVPYLWPLGRDWLEAQKEAVAGRGPIIVDQPRSYEWEPRGPLTTAEWFPESAAGRYFATLDSSLGTAESLPKMLDVLGVWDQRPRYDEHHALDVPALVIVGGNEPQKTIELSHEWAQQFKRGEFVIMPNTHHNAGNEHPIAWNGSVHDFLRRNGLPGGRPA